jgi:hypothetical protein
LILGNGVYDTGSTFFNGWIQRYEGGFVPLFSLDPIPHASYANMLGLETDTNNVLPSSDPYESEVYPKLRPKLEKAGLGVDLAELRDLPRMLRGTSKFFSDIWRSMGGGIKPFMDPKGLADHFLNANFGWIPFYGSMRKLYNAYLNQGQYLSRITRQNGQWHRRKWVHSETTTDIPFAEGVGYSVIPSGPLFDKMCAPDGQGRRAYWSMRLIKTERVWSVGSFKYYRPEFDDSQPGYHSAYNRIGRLMTLYGLRVNPSMVYNATPWTWLIDWFSNLGDHVDRVTDWGTDSIVARYMYLMHQFERRLELSQTINFKTGPRTMTWNRVIRSKQRHEADTGYGFNLSGDLTPRQLLILGALGLSR